jgi:O-antigen polymerase
MLLVILIISSFVFTSAFIHPFEPAKQYALRVVTLLILIVVSSGKFGFRWRKLDSAFLLYTAWQLSTIFILSTWASGRTAFEISLMIGLIYITLRGGLLRKTSIDTLSKIIAISAFLQSITAVGQYFDLFSWTTGFFEGFESKATGTLGGANILGAYLAISIPFTIQTAKSSNGRSKLGWLFILVVIMTALVFTKSRGAWLAVCFGLIILGWSFIRQVSETLAKHKVVLFTVSVLALVIIVTIVKAVYQMNPASADGRLFIWDVTLDMIRDHWLFGVGHGSFHMHWLEYQGEYFASGLNATDPGRAVSLVSAHSQVLHSFAATGLIGLSLYVSLFIIAIQVLMKSTKHGKPEVVTLLSALMIFFVHGLVEDVLLSIPLQLIFVIILAMSSGEFYGGQTKTQSQKAISRWFQMALIPLVLFASLSTFRSIMGELLWKEGRELAGSGRWDAGIDKYVSALDYLPHNHELMFALGAAYSMVGESAKAIELIEKSKEGLFDKNQYIAFSKAYIDLKDYEQALYNLNKVLYYYPALLNPHFWISRVHFERGDIELAKDELELIIYAENPQNSREVEIVKNDARIVLHKIIGSRRE